MKIKGIHIRYEKDGNVTATPQYWGKRGRTVTYPSSAVTAGNASSAVSGLQDALRQLQEREQ